MSPWLIPLIALAVLALLVIAFVLVARTPLGPKVAAPIGRLLAKIPWLQRLMFKIGIAAMRRDAKRRGEDRDATGVPLSDVELALKQTGDEGEAILASLTPEQRRQVRAMKVEDLGRLAQEVSEGDLDDLPMARSDRRRAQRMVAGRGADNANPHKAQQKRNEVAKRRAKKKASKRR